MQPDPVHALLGRLAAWKLLFLAVAFATLFLPLAESEVSQARLFGDRRHLGALIGILLIAGMNAGARWKASHPDPPKNRAESFRVWLSHFGGDLVGLAIWGSCHFVQDRLHHLTWAGGVNAGAWLAVLLIGLVLSPILVSRLMP